jgi:hypothetical protein
MSRWILLALLAYSCIASAQLTKRNINGAPYCKNDEVLTIKEAPPGYRGKGEVSDDGLTAYVPAGIDRSSLNEVLLQAYENQQRNGCVVKDFEDLLKKMN